MMTRSHLKLMAVNPNTRHKFCLTCAERFTSVCGMGSSGGAGCSSLSCKWKVK